MPNNSKAKWKFAACKRVTQSILAAIACSSSPVSSSSVSVPSTSTAFVSTSTSSIDRDEVSFIKELEGEINKHGALANLEESDYQIILDLSGWLNCDIIRRAQVLLPEANQSFEAFQRRNF